MRSTQRDCLYLYHYTPTTEVVTALRHVPVKRRTNKEKKMIVYQIGTKVIVKENRDITGVITKIGISGDTNDLVYSVEWWDERTLKRDTFYPSQLEATNKNPGKLDIGFIE
jgi:hypothetical protein